MNKSSRCEEGISNKGVYNATWLIHAPWAHPMWNQYVLYLYDLTKEVDGKKGVLFKDGMTHEFILYCIDPATPVDVNTAIDDQDFQLLIPANHGYQFPAASNEEAKTRIQSIVDRIDKKTISPDTDFRVLWNAMFQDGVTLLRGIKQTGTA